MRGASPNHSTEPASEEELDESCGRVESLCNSQNCWYGWCTASAAETLRLSTRHRPRPPPTPIRFDETLLCHTTPSLPSGHHRMKVEVTGEDSLEAARRLLGEGKPPLVLSMANGGHCGGGFLRGSNGQEEDLCARTTLFCELADAEYPLPDNGGLIISDVVVLRGPKPACAELDNVYHVAVVAAAAPMFPKRGKAYEALMTKKIDTLLRNCAAHGYKFLVLSAWGCGAFRNPPTIVARLFRAALSKSTLFEHVVFAVHDRKWEKNFAVFRRIFADLTEETDSRTSSSETVSTQVASKSGALHEMGRRVRRRLTGKQTVS